MGQTNLKQGLERKFALLAGEMKAKQSEIAAIESLFETLPTLNARTARIEHLLNCAEDLLTEIDPAWTRSKVKAVRPNVHKAPVALGRISKTALDVLREAEVPLTTREIMTKILAMDGIDEADAGTRQRISNSVDSTLRAKLGKLVVHDSGWPRRWKIAPYELRVAS